MTARSGLLHQYRDYQFRILCRGKPGKPRMGLFSGLKLRRSGLSGYGISIGTDTGTGSNMESVEASCEVIRFP